MENIILGIDVSKSSISCCKLAEMPKEPRQFFYDAEFHHFDANAIGIEQLLKLNPTIAVLEPTGVNYSRLWCDQLTANGVEVWLVGHRELRRYREDSLALPDKDDDADALALACYWFTYHRDDRRWVQKRTETIVKMRSLALRLQHLNRVQSPIINRARQDLAWQFPEAALVKSVRISDRLPLLWAWMAGERSSKRYDRLYADSCGSGLTEFTRSHALRICELQKEEMAIEREIMALMDLPELSWYMDVFRSFGFGQRTTAMLLTQIHPFEAFLENGQPIVKIRKGRKSGKPTRRHLSERRFLKMIGCAPSEESSGDKKSKKVKGGSSMCRIAIWQWVFTRIEIARTRIKGDLGESLGSYLDELKARGVPVKLVRARTVCKTGKALWKALLSARPKA